ncbi:MAG TPA: redoxin domain-containing protein [Candidatus Acidoferrum sp.]|nr:redoxin domain-containing protein [Candidatus Acidoferrum sp.]
MTPIKVGKKAPDFTLEDANEMPVSLAELKGKKVLLSWHPIAWTGVCTDQMRSLERNYAKFEELGTVAFGMSVDPHACKKAWASVLAIEKLRLLCDFYPHGEVAKDYGIFIEEYGMSGRANIIIDEEGVVKWVKVYQLGELPDVNEVLEVLSKM